MWIWNMNYINAAGPQNTMLLVAIKSLWRSGSHKYWFSKALTHQQDTAHQLLYGNCLFFLVAASAGKQKVVYPLGKQRFKLSPVYYYYFLKGKSKHTDSYWTDKGVYLHRSLQAPMWQCHNQNQDACCSSKLFIQGLNAFIFLIQCE